MLALGLTFIVMPMWIYTMFRPRRPHDPYLLSTWGDWLRWHVPFLGVFERRASLQQVAEILQLGLRAGSPLDRTLAAAAELDVNIVYRRRLRKWHDGVEAGQDAAGAARASRVGESLAWAFDAEINPAGASAVLESIHGACVADSGLRRNVARNVFWPVMMMLVAMMVGFVVFAIMMPTAIMIQTVMPDTIP